MASTQKNEPVVVGGVHHVGVQTADLPGSIDWYQSFFGCTVSWTLTRFSALSQRRLPGLTELVELAGGDLRFHLFVRDTPREEPISATARQFQHLCLAVPSPESLRSWRDRWFDLYDSGRYSFVQAEPATEIDVDSDGMQSFYCLDINGLEFEFSYFPGSET
ncbi:MAG TPA: VOC family protein [Actinophytocola sp.]|jgi:catechol 2,3-dioxygenase-like lactoylglutathione lyase family enzyme|nr:VOC family protein [Actinophytocola sp.]